MRPPQYSTATLIDLFHQQTVASLPEVMAALGTRAGRTAFRKLKELPYRTNYSHRGGYYTLEEFIDFDQHGLWSFRDVRFSAAGTLLATTAAMVSDAPAGQFSEELDNLLHVGTQDALRKLVQERKLTRQKVAGQFLYCVADLTRKAQQLSARRALLAAPGLVGPMPDADLMPDELRAAIVLFASLLDERQRRLYAGLESLKCGWGGDTRIAGLLGIDPGTVARGRKQLLAQDVERRRVRRPGGGRPPLAPPRGDRCHRSGLAARCRRRSHHRHPLGLVALIVGVLIGVPIGVYSAVRQDTVGDYVGRSFAIFGLATPNFWLATIILVFPAIWWGWSPPLRLVRLSDDFVRHFGMFIVPGLILGTYLAASTMRMTRTMMLEVLRQDYIRTAWAKGLRERLVILRHVIKNALIPVVTLVGLQLPIIVGGAVIMEQMFAIPGLGRLMIDALFDRDYPLISGINLFFVAAVMVINLLVDVLYAYLDPRVHYG